MNIYLTGIIRQRQILEVTNLFRTCSLPLSKVQLSEAERLKYIESVDKSTHQEVVKIEHAGKCNEHKKVVARGFEQTLTHKHTLEDSEHEWEERLLFVQSDYYLAQQQEKLESKLDKVEQQLSCLTVPKQGKKVLVGLKEVKDSVNKILEENDLEDLLVSIQFGLVNLA